MLNKEQQVELLEAARRTLEVFLGSGRRPVIDGVSSALLEPGGAFVTLHRGEALRGCIGTFSADDALLLTVQRMAIAAATQDPRFHSVSAQELADITLEISVLSPLRLGTPEEVLVGVHGLQISRGPRRGVLLPQVATEYGWDRETFLDHTCLKAGLPPGTWREPGTQLHLFTAQVFREA